MREVECGVRMSVEREGRGVECGIEGEITTPYMDVSEEVSARVRKNGKGVSHTHAHAHTLTLSHTLSRTHSHTHSLSPTRSPTSYSLVCTYLAPTISMSD